MRRALVAVTIILSLVTSTARADTLEELKDAWVAEASRLDAQEAEYAAAVAAQDRAAEALAAARRTLDEALADPSVPVAELRRLEAVMTRARDEALHAAEDASGLRERIYDTLEEMERIAAEMKAPEGDLAGSPDIDGMWRAEWGQGGDFGVAKLETKGHLVTGTYRLTDGRSGTVTGTATDSGLQIEIIDGATGGRATASLRFGASRTTASGTYQRLNVGDGRPAAGRLDLRKLDAAEANDSLRQIRGR